MKQLTAIIITISVLSVFNIFCVADDYYVDVVRGNNENTGTSSDNAWQTITHAVSEAKIKITEHFIIHVAPGKYDMSINEKFPIEPLNNMSLFGADKDITILDASESKNSVFKCDHVENISIEGFTLTGGSGTLFTDS